jgi:sec-independent protein translocase protein TatA
MLGTTEIILIVLALFLLFGASRLPKLAKSLGQSRRAFKEGLEEAEKEFMDEKTIDSESIPQIKSVSDEDVSSETRKRAEVE